MDYAQIQAFTDDAVLVQLAQRGDRAAFDTLAARYRRLVLRIMQRYMMEADAEDLTQETLARAWVKLPTLREPQAFSAWLSRLAANMARRRHQRVGDRVESFDEAFPSPMPDPLDAMLQHEFMLALCEALFDLPPINRQALIMHQWGHHSYQEIAERLGLPRNTVAARIRRARKQLSGLLGLPESVRTMNSSDSKEATMERYVINPDPVSPISRMVDQIIRNAVQEHAGEIIIEATGEYTAVRYHFGEQWHEVMTLPTFAHVPLLQRVKELAAVDQAAPAPQHGMINLRVNQQDYDAHINITSGEHGEILDMNLIQGE